MNKIKKHLFTAEDNVVVYADKGTKQAIGYLSEGEWLGIIEENELTYLVASSKHVGYVLISDCIELIDANFRVDHHGESPIYYGI